MPWHPLHAPVFIDPFWYNRLRGGEHQAQVNAPGEIELAGVRLRFEPHLAQVGDQVIVRVGRRIEFMTLAEKQAAEAGLRAAEAKRAEERRERLDRERAEALAFNAQIDLPVPWIPALKPVLSGLTENSMGDGANASTVVHIRLLDDLEDGRLKRRAWDFLCTSQAGDNGRFAEIQNEAISFDGDGHRYPARVTCRACLRLAKRWLKSGGKTG